MANLNEGFSAGHSASGPSGNFVDDGNVTAADLMSDDDASSFDPPADAPSGADSGGDYDYGDPADDDGQQPAERDPRGEQAANRLDQRLNGQQPQRQQAQREQEPDDAEGERGGRSQKPQAPDFSQEQIMRAARLGYTPAELTDFGSGRALEVALRRDEARILREQQRQPGQGQQPVNPFEHFTKVENLVPKLDKKALEEQGFSPEMIQAMEAGFNHMAAQIAPAFQHAAQLNNWAINTHNELARRETARQAAEQDRAVKEWNKDFNRIVDGLDEGWAEVVGTPEARQQLHTQCGVVAMSYQQMGLPVPENEQIVQQALRMLHGNRTESVVREQVRNDLHRREARGIARSRSSGGSRVPQTGEQRAIERIDRFKSGGGVGTTVARRR